MVIDNKKLNILQVNTSDGAGGAERIAWNLFRAYRERGLCSCLAVGHKLSNNSSVLVVPNNEHHSHWDKIWTCVGNVFSPLVGKVRGAGRLRNYIHLIGQLHRLLEIRQGHEDFEFPGTWKLLSLTPKPPNIMHCHNLHGGYFDLRALPWLSHQLPMVLTLHDAWLLSGHCAHSFECGYWKTGCGNCPDLSINPAIRRDATAYNWQRKREIYTRSRLYVATPSKWLMHKVQQSMLTKAIVEARIIPNGVDLKVFHPENQEMARELLAIPHEAKVLLFAGNSVSKNPWKDYATVEIATMLVAKRLPDNRVILLCLGAKESAKRIVGQAEIWFVNYERDPKRIASYYQAADIYVFATKADSFPNTVIESLACGTPVVATAVGGIPEQVEDGTNGFLVPQGNSQMMSARIEQLLCDDELRAKMSRQAANTARSRFSLDHQVNNYIDWYKEILNKEERRSDNKR